ncbi:MAG: TIM barrel protein [Clostridia bacterium]|nr:TIM barrel protein [Clostridia bacterium]
MKYSICIDMMFASLPFSDRIEETAKAGADAIEFWGWREKNVAEISEQTQKLGIGVALCNLDSKDPNLSAALMRGILTHGRADEFVQAIHESAPVMRTLGVKNAIVLAGDNDPDISPERAIENSFRVLNAGAKAAEEEEINLLFEPLNTYDRPTYTMPYSKDAFELVRGVGSRNIKVLLDLYHTQRMEGNLIDTLTKNIDLIGHFHVAGSPWRCEPDLGEVDYRQVFEAIAKTDYDGYIGFEYRQKSPDFDIGEYIKNLNI